MKIWIHIDNTQLGPYDISQLPLDRMTPATPVWYEGLPYWEAAGRAPLTAPLFVGRAPESVPTPRDVTEDNPDETSDVTVDVEEDVADINVDIEIEDNADTQGSNAQNLRQTQQYGDGRQYAGYQRCGAQNPADGQSEKCPPSYLVWSILLTILCCNPIGIIPIIIGATVSNKYNNYNYDGARRASECTAWWLMITIVTSLMLIPLSMVSVLL